MIQLKVESYCHNCPEFSPDMHFENWRPGEKISSTEIAITCKFSSRCNVIKAHLEEQLEAKYNERFTVPSFERKLCRMAEAKWVSIDDGSELAWLWRERPIKSEGKYFGGERFDATVGFLPKECFPSLQPGDCICVAEAEE